MQSLLQTQLSRLEHHDWVGTELIAEFERQIDFVHPNIRASLPLKASHFYQVNKLEYLGSARAYENLVKLTHPEAKHSSSHARDEMLHSALDLITTRAPVSGLCREFIWVEGVQYRGASSPKAMGGIFLGFSQIESLEGLAISIIHEMAHQELFGLNLIDPLVPRGQVSEHHSPFQGKARPPMGRLHSAHALYRMIEIEKLLAPQKVSEHQKLLHETITSFNEDDLTPFGRELCQNIYVRALT